MLISSLVFVTAQVLFLYQSVDDFVMSNINNYNGRDLITAESGTVDFSSKLDDVDDEEEEGKSNSGKLK